MHQNPETMQGVKEAIFGKVASLTSRRSSSSMPRPGPSHRRGSGSDRSGPPAVVEQRCTMFDRPTRTAIRK